MEDQAPQTSFADELADRSATTVRELKARAQAALAARREQMSRLERQIDEQLDALDESLANERSAHEAAEEEAARNEGAMDRLRDELTAAQAAWQQERQADEERIAELQQRLDDREKQLREREESLAQRDEDLCQRERELDARATELATREQSLEANCSREQDAEKALVERESAWAAERAALEAARDQATSDLEQQTAAHGSAEDDWKRRQTELETACSAAELERDKLAHELLASRDKLKAADELSAAATERDELKQKFDLALADVQRFRASVAELEQELARRPESGTADSAELTHLRAERDALAARVEELEQKPTSTADADGAQQVADLQRRFEMAVEDVRELKTKNAELEAKLGAAGKLSPAGVDSGNMDWESQKRRLLASLEGEGGSAEPEREEERATIQHTIEMTDAIVADKDRAIAELTAQLADRGAAPQEEPTPGNDAIESLIDADEVVREHRERAAELEKELEEKLRSAEMELSIERAKLAREKAEVEEWRLEMETFQKARDSGEPVAVAGAPRRRWLSKLGLNGDETN